MSQYLILFLCVFFVESVDYVMLFLMKKMFSKLLIEECFGGVSIYVGFLALDASQHRPLVTNLF